MHPLPPPFGETLPRSPLALVVCQLRYAEPTKGLTASLVTKIGDRLEKVAHPHPRIDQIQLQTVMVNADPGGTVQNQTQQGWRMISTDGRWIATLTEDSIAIETTRYGRWSTDFKPRMEALFTAFNEIVKPAVELRLGLRYVDLLTRPPIRSPKDWKKWIAPVLLGPLGDTGIGRCVVSTQQQMSLEFEGATRVTVRHGCYKDAARDNAYTYLIDTDHYRDSLTEFDLKSVFTACDELHNLSVSLFRYFITDALFEDLQKPLEK